MFTFFSVNRAGKGGKGKGKGKGGGGKGFGYTEGPPDTVVEMGTYVHACEGDMVVKSTNDKVHTRTHISLQFCVES
jgi:hypothetical protein